MSHRRLLSAGFDVRMSVIIATLVLSGGGQAQLPDLRPSPNPEVMSGFAVSNTRVVQGGSISLLSWIVRNDGQGNAPPFTISVRISPDADVMTGYRELWSGSHGGVGAESEVLQSSMPLTIPSDLPAGVYFVGAVLDPENAIAETDNYNNSIVSQIPLEVLASVNADLVPVATHDVGAIYVGHPTRTGTISSSRPLPLAPRGEIVFGYRIKNSGSAKSSGFTVAYYLSTDATITTNDTRLSSHAFGAINGGGKSAAVTDVVSLPASVGPGSYHVGLMVDEEDVVIETAGGKEANNVIVRSLTVLSVPPDTMPVWRVRLRVWTGTLHTDGTNAGVHVLLGGETRTFLDYARSDFDPGDDNWYDLLLDDIPTLREVNALTIGLAGTDGLCIVRIRLEVNQARYFDHDFPGRCQWIDNFGSVTIGYAEMREDPHWGTAPELVATIPASTISSLIQARVGTEIKGTAAYWGHFQGEAVELFRHSQHTINVDLDLAASVTGPDPDLGIDFRISFGCRCETLTIAISNVEVKAGGLGGAVANVIGGLVGFFTGENFVEDLENSVKTSVSGLRQAINLGTGGCPSITVTPQADVVFGVPEPTRDLLLHTSFVPQKVRPGETTVFTQTVSNVGNLTPAPYSVLTRMATQPDAPPESSINSYTSTGTAVDPCNNPQSTWTRPVYFLPSTVCGDYYHISQLSSDGDDNHANNTAVSKVSVGLPDIAIQSMTTNKASVSRYVQVTVHATLANLGIYHSSGLRASIYLRTTTNGNALPAPLTQVTLSPMSPNSEPQMLQFGFQVPQDVQPGSYHLALLVQQSDAAPECSLTNNEKTVALGVH